MSSRIIVNLEFHIVRNAVTYTSRCTATVGSNGRDEKFYGFSTNISYDIAKAQSYSVALTKVAASSNLFLSSLINGFRTIIDTVIGNETFIDESRPRRQRTPGNLIKVASNHNKPKVRNERFGIVDHECRLQARKERFGINGNQEKEQTRDERPSIVSHTDRLTARRKQFNDISSKKYHVCNPKGDENYLDRSLDDLASKITVTFSDESDDGDERRKLSPEEKKQLDAELNEHIATKRN